MSGASSDINQELLAHIKDLEKALVVLLPSTVKTRRELDKAIEDGVLALSQPSRLTLYFRDLTQRADALGDMIERMKDPEDRHILSTAEDALRKEIEEGKAKQLQLAKAFLEKLGP